MSLKGEKQRIFKQSQEEKSLWWDYKHFTLNGEENMLAWGPKLLGEHLSDSAWGKH